MCLEVYTRNQPLQIAYEHEHIRFLSPSRISSRYILLVRNSGFEDVKQLYLIYPRRMMKLTIAPEKTGTHFEYIPEHSAQDRTAELASFTPFGMDGIPPGQCFTAFLSDPNNPVGYIPNLTGDWHPGSQIVPFYGFNDKLNLLLAEHEFMAWKLNLAQELKSGMSQWLCFEILAGGLGCQIPTVFSTPQHPIEAYLHELSSPIDVHRTIVESFQTSLRELLISPLENGETERDRENRKIDYRTIIHDLGLNLARQVDIQYYELSIQPGNPSERFVLDISRTGDIRPRSGSPRVGSDPDFDREYFREPIYEFKSGSILQPTHPWRNSGFSLRMTLLSRGAGLE